MVGMVMYIKYIYSGGAPNQINVIAVYITTSMLDSVTVHTFIAWFPGSTPQLSITLQRRSAKVDLF